MQNATTRVGISGGAGLRGGGNPPSACSTKVSVSGMCEFHESKGESFVRKSFNVLEMPMRTRSEP